MIQGEAVKLLSALGSAAMRGRITGKAVEADVFGNPQFFRALGTGTIDNHDNGVIQVCLVNLLEDMVHLPDFHLRTDLPIQFRLHRANRSIDIGKRSFVTVVEDGAEHAPVFGEHVAGFRESCIKLQYWLDALDRNIDTEEPLHSLNHSK